jgi:hypothetical protein
VVPTLQDYAQGLANTFGAVEAIARKRPEEGSNYRIDPSQYDNLVNCKATGHEKRGERESTTKQATQTSKTSESLSAAMTDFSRQDLTDPFFVPQSKRGESKVRRKNQQEQGYTQDAALRNLEKGVT